MSTLFIALALGLMACGQRASSHAVYLVPGSSCKQWLAFGRGQHEGYVGGIAARAEVPAGHYDLGGIQRFIEQKLDNGCRQAATRGEAAMTKLGTLVPLRSKASTAMTTSVPKPAATSHVSSINGTTNDEHGNAASVIISAGRPEPLSQVSDSTPSACRTAVSEAGQSVNTTVAIPLHVSAELTSTLPARLTVDLANVYSIDPRTGIQPLRYNTAIRELWASAYSNGESLCPTAAEETWAAEMMTPHQAAVWEPWLVITGAITPDDPQGKATVSHVLIRPGAGVGDANGNGDLTPSGSGWVRCSVTEFLPHSESYLAIDPEASKAAGCVAD